MAHMSVPHQIAAVHAADPVDRMRHVGMAYAASAHQAGAALQQSNRRAAVRAYEAVTGLSQDS